MLQRHHQDFLRGSNEGQAVFERPRRKQSKESMDMFHVLLRNVTAARRAGRGRGGGGGD